MRIFSDKISLTFGKEAAATMRSTYFEGSSGVQRKWLLSFSNGYTIPVYWMQPRGVSA
jgi:hypothetical protein